MDEREWHGCNQEGAFAGNVLRLAATAPDGIGLCQFLVDQSVKVRDVDKVERHENPVVVIDEVTLATGYVIMGRAGPALPLPLAKAVP